MTLHRAGFGLLLKLLIVLAIINFVIYVFVPSSLLFKIVLGLSIILYLLVVNFFRFPNRLILVDDDVIMAPADGKVVVIEETQETEYFNDKRLQVSIFMNVFNVHINWFPINGIVTYCKHHKGNFHAAYLPKSSTENERSTIVIKSNKGQEVLMRQVAGAMAKRIVTYAQVGKHAAQDKHAGFIKFGSRVDLYLPLDTKIEVELGQKTIGSQTIIGRFK